MIDRSGDRHEAIERSNRVRDRFNEYAYDSGKSEIVFQIPSFRKDCDTPAVKVEILPFDDGIYSYAVQTNTVNAGMSSGFSPYSLRDNSFKATKNGVGLALRWALHSSADSQTEERQLKTIIDACKEFLSPKMAQTALL
jgi:hypothetical protein